MAFVGRPRTGDSASSLARAHQIPSLADALSGGTSLANSYNNSYNSSAANTGRDLFNNNNNNNDQQQQAPQVYYAPSKSPYAIRNNNSPYRQGGDTSFSSNNNNNNNSFMSTQSSSSCRPAGKDFFGGIQLSTFHEQEIADNIEAERQRNHAELQQKFKKLETMLMPSNNNNNNNNNNINNNPKFNVSKNQNTRPTPFHNPYSSSSTASSSNIINNNMTPQQHHQQHQHQQSAAPPFINSSSSYTNHHNNQNQNISPVRHHLQRDPDLLKSPGNRYTVFRLPPQAASDAGLPMGSSLQVPTKTAAFMDRVRYEEERDERQRELRDVLERLEGQAQHLEAARRVAKQDEGDLVQESYYDQLNPEQRKMLDRDNNNKNKNNNNKNSKKNRSSNNNNDDDYDDNQDENENEEDENNNDPEYQAFLDAKRLKSQRGERENRLLQTQYGKNLVKKIKAFDIIHDRVPIRRRPGESENEYRLRLKQYQQRSNNQNNNNDLHAHSSGDEDEGDYFETARSSTTSSKSTLPYQQENNNNRRKKTNNNNKSRKSNNNSNSYYLDDGILSQQSGNNGHQDSDDDDDDQDNDPLNLTMDQLSGTKKNNNNTQKSSSPTRRPNQNQNLGSKRAPSLGSGSVSSYSGAGSASLQKQQQQQQTASSQHVSPSSVENDASVRRRLHKHHSIRQLHLQEEETEMRALIEQSEISMRRGMTQLLVEQLRHDWEQMKLIHEAKKKFLATQAKLHDERTQQRLNWRAGQINQTVDEINYLRSISPMRGAPGSGDELSLPHRTVSPSRGRSLNSNNNMNMNQNQMSAISPYPPRGQNLNQSINNNQNQNHSGRPPLMAQNNNNNNNNNLSQARPLSPHQKREFKHRLMQDLLAAPIQTAEAVSPQQQQYPQQQNSHHFHSQQQRRY